MIIFLRKLNDEIIACATPYFFRQLRIFFFILACAMALTLFAQHIQILQQEKDVAILNLLLKT